MLKTAPNDSFERAWRKRGHARIAGVDEAGRGPLAGPVVAAAAVLDPKDIPDGLGDSKTLSASKRGTLYDAIRKSAEVSVGIASVEEIDDLNIYHASHLAMVRAVQGLATVDVVLIDGNAIPRDLTYPAEAIVKGDARCLSIAAASIIAKVTRDRIMVDLAQQHPGYGWEKNAGYGTKAHKEGLESHGVTPHHRRSFAPVHNILCRDKSLST
ncbi:MAG: ribonuclease HII [Pseudomonadota bacterium]